MAAITFYELIHMSLLYEAMSVKTPQFIKILKERGIWGETVGMNLPDAGGSEGESPPEPGD